MEKSPDAFRTISEVAEWLETPAHVLRFWESRFTQIKPVKRAGGRRYYRPADMALLGGIKKLLHEDGMTIRGVQKILREQGVKHVAGLSQSVSGDDEAVTLDAPEAPILEDAQPEAEASNVVPLSPAVPDPQMDLFGAPEGEAPVEDPSDDDAEPLAESGDEGPDAESVALADTAEAPAAPTTEVPPDDAITAAPDEAQVAPPPPAPPQDEGPAPEAPPTPLGVDLPSDDPADDAVALAELPLRSRLRDPACATHLAESHAAVLAAASARLRDLRARMTDDA